MSGEAQCHLGTRLVQAAQELPAPSRECLAPASVKWVWPPCASEEGRAMPWCSNDDCTIRSIITLTPGMEWKGNSHSLRRAALCRHNGISFTRVLTVSSIRTPCRYRMPANTLSPQKNKSNNGSVLESWQPRTKKPPCSKVAVCFILLRRYVFYQCLMTTFWNDGPPGRAASGLSALCRCTSQAADQSLLGRQHILRENRYRTGYGPSGI